MLGVNRVTLMGNLAADPDVRETTSGKKLANFSIATDYRWKDKEGKTYFKVYLVNENTEFLKTVKWKEKNRTNPIMVDKKGLVF